MEIQQHKMQRLRELNELVLDKVSAKFGFPPKDWQMEAMTSIFTAPNKLQEKFPNSKAIPFYKFDAIFKLVLRGHLLPSKSRLAMATFGNVGRLHSILNTRGEH